MSRRDREEALQTLCNRGMCLHASKEEKLDRLIIPDVTKEQRNEVFTCLPITTDSWWALRQQGEVHQTENGKDYQVRQKSGHIHTVVIIYQHDRDDEDDLVAACAWLRLIHGVQETIYIVPHQRGNGDNIYSLINRGVGQYQNRILSLDTYTPISPMWVKRAETNAPA